MERCFGLQKCVWEHQKIHGKLFILVQKIENTAWFFTMRSCHELLINSHIIKGWFLKIIIDICMKKNNILSREMLILTELWHGKHWVNTGRIYSR